MDVLGKFSYKKTLKAHDLKGTKNCFSRILTEIFELCQDLPLGKKKLFMSGPGKGDYFLVLHCSKLAGK